MVNCIPFSSTASNGGLWSYDEDGYDSMTVQPAEGDPVVRMTSVSGSAVAGARCYGRTTLERGESAFVTLSWDG